MRLQSVELELPEVGRAAEFLEACWGLLPAGSADTTRFFRGTGDHPHILSLTEAAAPALAAITFSGSSEEREVIGPGGEKYRFVAEREPVETIDERDKPIQLTHVVINSTDVEASERFAVEQLGFKVSDRTAHMRFLRCNRKHHALAYAGAKLASLNHIAFEMRDVDAVMRGIGRLRDAGFDAVWGPGRHGPGNNVFGYFIAPWGGIIEYTAEVTEVGEDHRVGSPEDWKWPPGRIDHWGVSKKDTARTAAAEQVLRFK
jgi:catechol 2,3-dioxygenase-like lactoylglutathione lyase family enzyme